ncbi:hypothetical protein OIU84_018060 [Salix udensis]|uniref:MADS-box domain-containing protein n=1 Tax=Salix udensis TaxID=889485 RepID=A0AAD6L3C6_9ROSI|nr:hypothetical protein OIU84_018060 [Salix udensis]
MTRKKVKLAYITNDSARKATFKKRKKGLMKKVSELSTLCGIEACAIICSPYDAQPERKDNREKEVTQAMFQCLTGKSLQNLNLMDLNDLGWMIDQNLKEINKRFGTFQTATTSQMAAASMAGPSGEHASQRAEVQTFEVKK